MSLSYLIHPSYNTTNPDIKYRTFILNNNGRGLHRESVQIKQGYRGIPNTLIPLSGFCIVAFLKTELHDPPLASLRLQHHWVPLDWIHDT